MTEEFNLSDLIYHEYDTKEKIVKAVYVSEFIRLLKKQICLICSAKEDNEFMPDCNSDVLCGECKELFDSIDNLAGDKLVKGARE